MIKINCNKKYGMVVFGFEDGTEFRITYDKLVWNKPSGNSFRSHCDGDIIVNAKIDGFIISRSKGAFNLYEVNYEKALDIQKIGANLFDTIQITLIVTNVIKIK